MIRSFLIIITLTTSFFFIIVQDIHAQSASDIQAKIDQRNKDIADLETQIQNYQKQIDSLDTHATSLSQTIESLDLSRKKLEANISVTQDKISSKNLEIQKIGGQIVNKEGNIADDKRIILHSLNELNQREFQSLTQIFLGSDSLSAVMDSLEKLGILETNLHDRIGSLNSDKQNLENNRIATEKAKTDLVALNKQLSDQKSLVLTTVTEQKSLLSETNQSEASYKKLLADKKAEEAAFQTEINSYESQLHILVSPSSIPHSGSGVLAWPLDNIYITQYFGNTSFATANPQIYNGKGHTGVDFRASIGTPVKSAMDGTVVGIGNTDLVAGCYSFGKWIMIKHPNGLSTLYAHLSLQSVAKGESVSTGELIGYSGNTGYSTGPHLHFGVYATQGVQIKLFDTSINCKGAIIPVADFSAYLNPLSYL